MDDAEEQLDRIAARLARAGFVAAHEEATELVAAAPHPLELEAWVRRREAGEPMAWIIRSVRFCGQEVGVDRGVYVPRPQTEALARRAACHLSTVGVAAESGLPTAAAIASDLRPGAVARAADLCTGAGAVAVHLAATCPRARVVGVDVDPRAVACARRNGVRSVLADLEALEAPLRPGAFDVVTAVAPYVPSGELHVLPADVQRYEPRRSLDGGPDGLRLVRRVVEIAGRLLRPGGRILLEVGGEQDLILAPTLTEWGFEPAESWYDDEGDLRGIVARRRPSTARRP